MAEYRFYVNRGRMNVPEIAARFDVINLDSKEGGILRECVPLSYVPTEAFRGNMTPKEMFSIARMLYNRGHDVTVTDPERRKKITRLR